MAQVMEQVDLYVGGDDLAIANLTGHPTAVFPDTFREQDGRDRPGSITFTGRLYEETTLLAVAHAFQQAAGLHLRRPPLDKYLDAVDKPESQQS
jgi:Asp-tRNA(Asn)/Glu-tRNA(Gln) amidotransferase A subunit family amidase